MQRDYGSYFQDKLNWWFVAGQFYYYKDPIHGLAVTFAPVLYDIIDFLYNEESDSFYDTLNKNEKEIVIPGMIQENKKDESINIEKKYNINKHYSNMIGILYCFILLNIKTRLKLYLQILCFS